MKKLLLLYALIGIFFVSCNEEKISYRLITTTQIPDSLKEQHHAWIQETIRAASQHMTGGDYGNVDATIRQAKRTADDLFGVETITLIKVYRSGPYAEILPEDMTPEERRIYEDLLSGKK
jgi:hypothetical protein